MQNPANRGREQEAAKDAGDHTWAKSFHSSPTGVNEKAVCLFCKKVGVHKTLTKNHSFVF
jgi:hypothetical protein